MMLKVSHVPVKSAEHMNGIGWFNQTKVQLVYLFVFKRSLLKVNIVVVLKNLWTSLWFYSFGESLNQSLVAVFLYDFFSSLVIKTLDTQNVLLDSDLEWTEENSLIWQMFDVRDCINNSIICWSLKIVRFKSDFWRPSIVIFL